eukprot:751456-Hanusia_phi.AAC.1
MDGGGGGGRLPWVLASIGGVGSSDTWGIPTGWTTWEVGPLQSTFEVFPQKLVEPKAAVYKIGNKLLP